MGQDFFKILRCILEYIQQLSLTIKLIEPELTLLISKSASYEYLVFLI